MDTISTGVNISQKRKRECLILEVVYKYTEILYPRVSPKPGIYVPTIESVVANANTVCEPAP